MKIFKNQTGAVDIILILIVFVLAAGLGGYVYYNQKQAQKSYAAAGQGTTVAKHTVKKATKTTPTIAATPSTPTDQSAEILARVKVVYTQGVKQAEQDGYLTQSAIDGVNAPVTGNSSGGNPVTCVQTYPGQNPTYSYSVPKISGTSATMSVIGDYGSNTKVTINLDLVEVNNAWQINAFSCPS